MRSHERFALTRAEKEVQVQQPLSHARGGARPSRQRIWIRLHISSLRNISMFCNQYSIQAPIWLICKSVQISIFVQG